MFPHPIHIPAVSYFESFERPKIRILHPLLDLFINRLLRGLQSRPGTSPFSNDDLLQHRSGSSDGHQCIPACRAQGATSLFRT